MHIGIQCWEADGSSCFVVDVVWYLRPAPLRSSRPGRVDTNCEDSGAARLQWHSWSPMVFTSTSSSSDLWSTHNPNSYNSDILENSVNVCNDLPSVHGFCENSVNACDALPFLHGRIRPELPRFQFGVDELLPVNLETLLQLDTPVDLYRMRRLMRALGQLPRSMRLPLSTPPACPAVSSSSGTASSAVPPSPAVGPTCLGPYRGEYSAVLWNAQAFFCEDQQRFADKQSYARKLLGRADILLLNETHGTDGGNKAWRPPIGTSAWWSAGPTPAHAGVGIIIRNEFIQKFSKTPKWRILWPGRAAVLSLRGAEGWLDIVVGYFHTGGEVGDLDKYGVHPNWSEYCSTFPKLREHMRHRISTAIQPRHRVLTLFGADFNWVPQNVDRRSKTTMDCSGGRNPPDERHFQSILGQAHGLVELHQPEMTRDSSTSTARLDRFYSNHHLVEQIDRELQSVALEWRLDLSDHRALFVARRLPSVLDDSTRPISPGIYKHNDYQRRVRLALDVKLQEYPDASRLKKLTLLKESMREVASNMSRTQGGVAIATEKADQMGVVMRYLRAAEKESLGTISQCLSRYPHIATLVTNPYELKGNLAVTLRALKDHAVDLAREIAIELMQSAQTISEENGNFEADRKKKKGMRLLHKLAPGKGGAVGAVVGDRGEVLSDPQDMANHLRKHWAEVFRARGVDETKLQTWLDEDGQQRSEQGPTHDAVQGLRLRKRAIRKALKLSNNSAPGPDGLPYGAWRALGDLAVDLLHGAFVDLTLPEGPNLMREDYPNFNASILIFLPKKPVGKAADDTPVFEASGVRPLNVTNCDNRLIASAVRLTLESVIGPFITSDQRGFLPGRSMMANLLDVDESILNTATQGERGMALFFDFAAAFPSVEHVFVYEILSAFGLAGLAS